MSVKRNMFAVLVLCLVLVLQGCTGGGGREKNKPPKIDSFTPAERTLTVVPEEEVNFSVVASDPDGDSLSYSWSETGDGTLTAGTSSTAKWKGPKEAGTATVKVTVTDGKAGVASVTWNITISSVKPPIITNASPETSKNSPFEVNVNEEHLLSITTSDPGGRPLTSTWTCSKGEIKNEALNTAKWVAPGTTGSATVTVTVSNGIVSSSHTWYFNVKGNVVYVNEDITIPTKWASGNIYVIPDGKYIYVKSTLTIDPGAIIKLGQGSLLLTNDGGRIDAVGTVTNHIVFTSLRDDLHGGDTNKDQESTTPDSGDWYQVQLGTTGNRFEYCDFFYGGGGAGDIMLDLYRSVNSIVKNCTFAFSKGYGVAVSGATSPTIEGNVFYNNERPLAINANISLDDSNTFHNPNNPLETNEYQGIFVDPNVTSRFDYHVTWAEKEVAYVLYGWDFTIEETVKVTLKPGVTLKFDSNRLYVEGIIEAKGTASEPIVFTSINDDSHGGQSNGSHSNVPQAGDWEYVYIGNDARGVFDYCIFSYGGTMEHQLDGYAALYDQEYSLGTVITNSIFAHNKRGLDLMSRQSSISDSMFVGNVFPIRIGFDINTDNTLTFSTNTYNAIYVGGYTEDATKSHVLWQNTTVPYVLLETPYFSGTAVELGQGTIVRVWHSEAINLYDGATFLNFPYAVFTSYRDVLQGGDVGGGPVDPQNGDWEGIWDEAISDYRSAPNIYYAKYN